MKKKVNFQALGKAGLHADRGFDRSGDFRIIRGVSGGWSFVVPEPFG